LNPKLRWRERERERRKIGGWFETLHLTRRSRAKFAAMEVPRQYPLVLLVKVGWRGMKKVEMKVDQGEKLSGVPLLRPVRTQSSDIKLWEGSIW
jgi:hypothetical protein